MAGAPEMECPVRRRQWNVPGVARAMASGSFILALLLLSRLNWQDDNVLRFSTQINPIEMLTIQSLMHVPECAADKHCRSACRMVCQETNQNLGTEADHASSLIAFGCCFNSPLMAKEIPSPLSDGRETQLLEMDHFRPRQLRRTLLSTDLELQDRHSLEADYAQLRQQEVALKKRISLLPLKNDLPSKVNKHNQVQGLMEDEFNGWNEGFTDGEFGWIWNQTAWNTIPKGSQGGWFADNVTEKAPSSDNDPFGTESHFFNNFGKSRWNGRQCNGTGCPEMSDGWQNDKKIQEHLEAANIFGTSAKLLPQTSGSLAPEVEYGNSPPGADDDIHSERYPLGYQRWQWPTVDTNGTVVSDMTSDEIDSWAWNDDPMLSYHRCLRKNNSIEVCVQNLNKWHDQKEWRPKPCNDTDSDPLMISDGSVQKFLSMPGEFVKRNDSDFFRCGFELVSARTEKEGGYDAARGLVSSDDIEAGLAGKPSQELIKHFLGDRMYEQFQEEERAGVTPGHSPTVGNMEGSAHRLLAQGMKSAQRRKAFKDAYGQSEWEWCLKQHRNDRDFPKACTSPISGQHLFTAKPYQSRHKELTAPEKILNGVEEAFNNLIGTDKQEQINDKIGIEALHPHPNNFQYGSETVRDGHVQGTGPAWWERMKGVRDVPQSVEGKALEASDRNKLPGVVVESWNGWPTLNRGGMKRQISMTANKCCSTFMHLSKLE